MNFDSNGIASKTYYQILKSISITDLVQNTNQDPSQFRLFIFCYMEKDECKSDNKHIPVISLVQKEYYDQNYLENQPNYSKLKILDR